MKRNATGRPKFKENARVESHWLTWAMDVDGQPTVRVLRGQTGKVVLVLKPRGAAYRYLVEWDNGSRGYYQNDELDKIGTSLTPNDLYKDWDNVNFAQRQAEKSGDQKAIAAAKADVRRVYDLMQEERQMRARRNPRRRTSRRPRRNPGMDAAQFCEAVKSMADLHGKALSCKHGGMGSHSQVFINFINLPADRVREGRGGGAEAENNRFAAVVAGFSRQLGEPPPTGKVKVETSVALSQFPKPRISLRGKTGTPEAIAKYVADFISKVAAEVPGNFTHANPRRNSRKRASRRPKKRTSRRAR